MGDWVEVNRMGLAAEPECFQRNRPAACERVQNSWSTSLGPRMQELVCGGDQLAGRLDELRVVRVLPLHQMLDELKATIARRVLETPFSLFPVVGVRGVIN